MSVVKITFPDGNVAEYPKETSIMEIAEKIGPRLAMAALAAKVNGKLVDMSSKISGDSQLQIITGRDKEGLEVIRHSSAHLLAQALTRMYPDIKLTIGPVVEEGFYYDIDSEKTFSTNDFAAIEAEMEKIVKEDLPVYREELSKRDALKLFATNDYKVEMIEAMDDATEKISMYKQGEFFDLCRGPHVPRTSKLKAVKLMKVAGAYWRADSNNKQLQRIYGTAFIEKKDLDAYLKLLEEAEKRDHRKLTQDLNLVYFHEYSPGAPFFLFNGTIIYNELLNFIRSEYQKRGYKEVITPQMYNKKLWETSGHWEHYRSDMFVLDIEGQEFSLKPMNCPSHCLIYNRDVKSYKDLPIRIADFCSLHRNEFSGTLTGMVRVRKFSQDDAHIFCRFDQIEDEVFGVLEFIKYVWNEVFNFKLKYYLSTKPEKSLGTKELWDQAEGILASALKKADIPYEVKPGDGAFYGPKIDIDIEDALGRKWQCPTCQLDFNLPQRFETMYVDNDGKKQYAVMIHRAILGSLERFFGIMTEHFAGKFPLWLSPVQVKLLPIADRHTAYCKDLQAEMHRHGIRVEVDERTESTPKKVRDAQLLQIPLMITIGDKEMENHTLAVRTLDGKVKFGVSKEAFIQKMVSNIRSKSLTFDMD
jgi:threonyl-tRNA synthetase